MKRIINYNLRWSPNTITETTVSGVFMLSTAKQVFRQ